MEPKELWTRWHNDANVLMTKVSGVLTQEDVQAWKDGLYAAGGSLPGDGEFRMLIDIRRYEVADQDLAVHKIMREVTPVFLAAHGFRVGFFDLYKEEPPTGREEGRALCTAVAHVHHDCGKMDRYNELLSSPRERFFCSRDEAWAWLENAG